MSSLEAPKSKRTPWMIASVFGCLVVCPLLLILALGMLYFISQANQPSGMLPVAIELVGTSTPYPTHTPYFTATPYYTATPYETPTPFKTPTPLMTPTAYPTVVPYPTTGAFRGPLLYRFGACELKVENNYLDRDAVIILANVDTNAIATAVYVRARDSLTHRWVELGTYYTYVELGQDWDNVSSRFKNNAETRRFEEPATFGRCDTSIYDSLKVILNISSGSGKSTILVPANSFPRIAPYSFPGISP